MNKKFLLLLFFPAISIIFLLFWGNSESHRSHVKELHIKEKEIKTYNISTEDNGSTINIKKGDRLNVSLVGNPSTGYSWELLDYDSNILEQSGEMVIKNSISDEQVSDVTGTVVGGPGTFNFSFVANTSGEALLHFVYHRHWEKDIEPEDNFYLNVEVQD